MIFYLINKVKMCNIHWRSKKQVNSIKRYSVYDIDLVDC